MHVVVLVQLVQKLTDFIALRLGEFGELFGNVTDFAGHHGPAVGSQPFGNRGHGGAFADELRAGAPSGMSSFSSCVSVSTSLAPASIAAASRSMFDVRMMRFDQAHVVKQKLVAAAGGQLALFEQHADFRRGAVHVIGINLHDHRHVMRRAAFIRDVLHDHLLAADAGALVDGALDGVLVTLSFSLFPQR